MTNLHPVQRRSVPDEVAEQLTDVIVTGEVPPGDQLPSERDLAERLGVSRPTVRAALTRLAAIGLVETRQGGGSVVRDFRRHAGLDLLPRLLLGRGGVDVRVVRDIVEARSSLGPQVASMAAGAAAGPAEDEDLLALAAAIGEGEDHAEQLRTATAFWDLVVDRGGSIVYRLLYNQLRSVFEPALAALAELLSAETDRPELFVELAEAIVAGDPDRAGECAADLLARGEAALLGALDDLVEPTGTSDPDPTDPLATAGG